MISFRDSAGNWKYDGHAALPAALLRPGRQPCNQIEPTLSAAMARLHIGHSPDEWRWLHFGLRVGRKARRVARRMIDRETAPIVAEILDHRRTLQKGARG